MRTACKHGQQEPNSALTMMQPTDDGDDEQQKNPPTKAESRRETPQTITLGRSCDDQDDVPRPPPSRAAPPGTNSAPTSPSEQKQNGWLSRMLKQPASSHDDAGGEQRDVSNNSTGVDRYQAMGDESYRGKQQRMHPLQIRGSTTEDMVYTALGGDKEEEKPDVLLQQQPDDGFFFRSTDTSPRHNRQQPWKALRRNNRHRELFGYSDAVAVLSPPVLQRYRTRYAQLNQTLPPCERHGDSDDDEEEIEIYNDLQLDESDQSPTGSSLFRTVPQSSLLYEQADGRRLMHLPRDQVRLLMDPDLEPGVLSVEDPHGDNSQTKDDLASLQYVLTVDEDLYRKIVAEMSPTRVWSCREGYKADIRVALAILLVVMVVLWINMVAFHEK